jgi:hypothetical protein
VATDGIYCTNFDWGLMLIEHVCGQLFRVGDRYFVFPVDASLDTVSGSYRFQR